MAQFKKRTEIAYKYMVELQVGRIDEIQTNLGTNVKVVNAMGQPCKVTQDFKELTKAAPENIEFYEIASIPDFAKFIATGNIETGRPIYWMCDMDHGVFVLRPKEFYINPLDAFTKLYSDVKRRGQYVTDSYVRNVLESNDLIKPSLYINGISDYTNANEQFNKILSCQKKKQK